MNGDLMLTIRAILAGVIADLLAAVLGLFALLLTGVIIFGDPNAGGPGFVSSRRLHTDKPLHWRVCFGEPEPGFILFEASRSAQGLRSSQRLRTWPLEFRD